mgnify:CR=1 FL=1
MGLDNGIIVRTKEKSEFFSTMQRANSDIDEPIELDEGIDNGFNYEYEVAYWRKCYGIRSHILSIIRRNHDEKTEGKFNFPLTVDDLKDIQWLIYQCSISKRYFDDQANSIFEYDAMRPILERQVRSLEILIQEKLKQGDNIKVIFYDSY